MPKYLQKMSYGYRLNFYLPTRYGGKRIRISLGTSSEKRALELRDKIVMPLMYEKTAVDVLNAIAEKIETHDKNLKNEVAEIKNKIFGRDDMDIESAVKKYLNYLDRSSLAKASKQNYTAALHRMLDYLNPLTPLNNLDKPMAIHCRDSLIEDNMSPTRLKFTFQSFRAFLRWCEAEGLSKPALVENFLITLPKVKKTHTSDIPPHLADKAMNVISDWTLIPRISRYTGMRLTEVSSLTPNHLITMHTTLCFHLTSDITKTSSPRIIPVAEKLKPYITDLPDLKITAHQNDKYNRKVKTIPGLEKVSFHSWRVYANTRMLESGIDKAVRMKILGHKTTRDDIHTGYTSVQLTELIKAVNTIP
ncbi:MAG: hypothetical protein K9M56_04430 [Victivallales bacterium]|nr:hypothetical protein [Victivallales bacterium]